MWRINPVYLLDVEGEVGMVGVVGGIVPNQPSKSTEWCEAKGRKRKIIKMKNRNREREVRRDKES